MRLTIVAVGRLRQGPERALVVDYLDRASKTGRGQGLGPFSVTEVEAKKGGMDAEAELLAKASASAGITCCLDERGRTLTSPDFATLLANWRDTARGDVSFLIGGADGLSPQLRERADLSISLGKMVWPHMLARVMLAEQLYRATAILAGTPYHRA